MKHIWTRWMVVIILIVTIVGSILTQSKKTSEASHLMSSIEREKSQRISNLDLNRGPNRNKGSREFQASARRIAYFNRELLPKFNLAEFQGYLDANNRSPRSLVAVYLLTDDASVLPELKKHTDDAEAMLCLASARSLSPEERKNFAEVYCKLNPNQMQGYLVSALIATREGNGKPKDKDAFLDLVKKGMNSDEVTLGFDRVPEDQRKALESIGTDRLDVEALLGSMHDKADEILFNSRSVLVLASKMELEGSQTLAQKVQITTNYLSVAQSIKEIIPYANPTGLLRYYGLMNDLLEQLPPDSQLGDEWGRVEDLRERLRAECSQYVENGGKWVSALENAPPEIADQFFETRIEVGQEAAQAWLLSQANSNNGMSH